MSSVKCIGLMSAAGAALAGGMGLYKGIKDRNFAVKRAGLAVGADGLIPIGGRTKDGGFWDGHTTLDQFKKDANKRVAITTAISTLIGAAFMAGAAALTLSTKARIK